MDGLSCSELRTPGGEGITGVQLSRPRHTPVFFLGKEMMSGTCCLNSELASRACSCMHVSDGVFGILVMLRHAGPQRSLRKRPPVLAAKRSSCRAGMSQCRMAPSQVARHPHTEQPLERGCEGLGPLWTVVAADLVSCSGSRCCCLPWEGTGHVFCQPPPSQCNTRAPVFGRGLNLAAGCHVA